MTWSKLWVLITVVVLILLAVYAAASWYFSGLVISSPAASPEAARGPDERFHFLHRAQFLS